jgi:hypothetical protein
MVRVRQLGKRLSCQKRAQVADRIRAIRRELRTLTEAGRKTRVHPWLTTPWAHLHSILNRFGAL